MVIFDIQLVFGYERSDSVGEIACLRVAKVGGCQVFVLRPIDMSSSMMVSYEGHA